MWFQRTREVSPMTALLQARDWTRHLERDEAAASGLPVAQARARVARRLGTTPAALEHVSRGRAKRVSADLWLRLRQAVISKLQREIARAEHDLELACQSGVDPRSAEMAALVAATARAEKLMDD